MTDAPKYRDPATADWWERKTDQWNPVPLFDRSVLFGTISEMSNGLLLSHAAFRDFEHFRSVLHDMLPTDKSERADTTLGKWKPSDAGERWTYGQTRKEARDQWDRGLAPGDWARTLYRDTVDALRAEMIAAGVERCTTNKRRRVKQWAGGNLSVPRYLESRATGKPTPVFRRLSRNAQRPIVRLGLNSSTSSDNKRETFIKTTAMIGSMVEQFERLGFGVEVVGLSCQFTGDAPPTYYSPCGLLLPFEAGRRRWMATSFLIKKASERLDPERMMSIGQSGTLRDYGFRTQWAQHGINVYGRGQPLDVPREIVTEGLGLDCMVETTWSRGGAEGQARRLVGKIQQLADQAHGE